MSTRETLSASNVRPGLRIRQYAGEAQDRTVQGVYPGRDVVTNGVASGRTTFIAWRNLGRYYIVPATGLS